MSENYAQPLHRGSGGSPYTRKAQRATQEPQSVAMDDQPDAREGRLGAVGWRRGS